MDKSFPNEASGGYMKNVAGKAVVCLQAGLVYPNKGEPILKTDKELSPID